jgi:diguanylate cyclase (GGDEF)-like protein
VADDQKQRMRILIADDEAELREAYRQILVTEQATEEAAAFEKLRLRLYSDKAAAQPQPPKAMPARTSFDVVFCDGAEAAVAAVRDSLKIGMPFAMAFLDVRMPPGPDGVWAATRIRELEPAMEIVICTAFSDVDAGEIARLVPPEEKLSYLQKPFHPSEIRQMALSLASKWRAERRIIKLAYFDPLTGLPNREQSRSRMSSAIATAARRNQSLAVLYLDLDDFKRVNDTLGHSVGDQLLCLVAERLRDCLRPGDTIAANPLALARSGHIARLGGDEFIVLLPELRNEEEAARVAARLIDELKQPINLGLHTLVVTPSIGIAVFPRDGTDVDTLLRHADLAMYFAKRASPGGFQVFSDSMHYAASKRFAIEEQLRDALPRGEFALLYQPQFDVVSGAVSGVEALLRWNNDQLGCVAPADFIPVAEETGLIVAIGDWVMRQACRQARKWRDEGLPVVRMAVNVSARQFAMDEFPSMVEAIIKETGIEASMLELEITESVVMQDQESAERTFARLKALGVSLAIDDFGTGYSSFARLRHFSVNRLKIDRSFVTNLVDGTDDRAITAAIIAMSQSLRISVTAEGVETFPQLVFLQQQACHDAQGYFFSRPLTPEDAGELLRRAAATADSSNSARLRALIEPR